MNAVAARRARGHGDEARERMTLAAARLRGRCPGWHIQEIRVHDGWAIEAGPEDGEGGTTAVIGTPDEVEAAIRAAGTGGA